jgi:hypothetical protein
MCGKHINIVRQAATRLAASYKQDFVPLDGIKDTFTIRLCSGELVIIHIIEQPYHYTRDCDGSTNVNGIIYVVDMNTFDKEYRQVYRHFHDIAGEFRANTLHCLLIGFDAEELTLEHPLVLHDPLNYNTETHYTPMDVMVGVLRINEMFSCYWYKDSIVFYCNSTEQQLADIFDKKWTGRGKGRKLAKDVSDVDGIVYSYSSSDEETVEK